MASRVPTPRRRAVSTTDRTLADSLAPHSDRKQLVTFRKTTQGLKARSEPLLVGGIARLVTKTNRFWRYFLMMRCSFSPAEAVFPDPGSGTIFSNSSSLVWRREW